MNIFKIVDDLNADIADGGPIRDEGDTDSFDCNEQAYFAGVEAGRREVAERLQPQLKELAHLIQYLDNVVRPHFEVPNHRHCLGCDIALTWLKRTNNQELTEDEKLTLIRHLPHSIKIS